MATIPMGNLPVEVWSNIINAAIDKGGHDVFHGIVEIMDGAIGATIAGRAMGGFGPAQRDRFQRVCIADHHGSMIDAVRHARVFVAEVQLAHAQVAAGGADDANLVASQALPDAAQAAYNGLGPDANVTPVLPEEIAALPATRHNTLY
jgi:hypothetical protein